MSLKNPMVSFNGGKMDHVFCIKEGAYEPAFTCEAAQRCFEDPNSVASLKVHGECCLLVSREKPESEGAEFEWIFATRYDAKQKPLPEDAIPVPHGSQPATFQKHSYCFLPLPKDKVVGKGKRKSHQGPDTYAAIAAGVASGALPDPNDDAITCPPHITVEWVGRKHQGNTDHVEADHGLYVHGSTVVDVPERSWEAAQRMAQAVSIEGVVFYDTVTGERFKLRFDNFSDSLFAKKCKQPITEETTSLKPKVIVAAEAVSNDP
mmetsp:Transcript_14246/g.23587  ORF Transcript_14246/g.23587 Transcript_14246/m.23587 type:complete len:263 (-) Transcript_14246:62-850(-)|eukprot:CAMPEP_0119004242 /NCGR_PEP_ID=MMETSP1176-20130426/1036_1 /TAXON_ID=265551 /ORGANISM="Synedropsis recta cf, Strain CCMP1620" /LENGTH=262 /DNA_ID=CAMNT_0006955927 /DNA_START=85 /DNA_END=873 /DNA_ORIENTATION=+